MAVDFEFKDSVYWIRFSGEIEGGDMERIIAAFEKMESDHPVTPHRISDLTGVTDVKIGFDDVLGLAAQRRAKVFKNPFKSAIVANNEIQTGFARMFQTLNTNPQITIRIFPDAQAALAWIIP